MKVKDLIEKLNELPSEMTVLVRGYESGYYNPETSIKEVREIKHPDNYHVNFEDDNLGDELGNEAYYIGPSFKALILS